MTDLRLKNTIILLFLLSSWTLQAVPNGSRIDLTGLDLATSPVALSGSWSLLWNELESKPPTEKELPKMSLPGNWTKLTLASGEQAPGQGFATLFLTIRIDEEQLNKGPAIYIPAFTFASRIYANGKLLNETGKVAASPDEIVRHYNIKTVAMPSEVFQKIEDGFETELALQIANFSHARGGPTGVLKVGTLNSTNRLITEKNLLIFLAIGAIGIIGLYNFVLFGLRRAENYTLLLGLFCSIIVIRLILTGRLIEQYGVGDWYTDIAFRVEYFTVYFGGFLFVSFFNSFFHPFFQRRLTLFIQVVALLFAASVFLSPKTFTGIVDYYFFMTVVTLLYCLVNIVRAGIISKEITPWVSLLGFLFLFTAVLNDILFSRNLINTGFLIHYGLVGFLFAQAVIVALSNHKARSTAEYLTHNLQLEVQKKTAKLAERQKQIEDELKLAKTVQQSLLPNKEYRNKYLSIFCSFLPMADLAGDIFDLIELDDNRVGILLADVKGHGIPAALISMMVKISFVNNATDKRTPAETLQYMNNELYNAVAEGDFVALMYIIFEPDNQRFSYAKGGQRDILHFDSQTAKVLSLEGGDSILGFRPNLEYRNFTGKLNSGDKVYFFTDGLIEEQNELDEQFGELRIQQILLKQNERDVRSINRSILAELYNFKNKRHYNDDITLIGVEFFE